MRARTESLGILRTPMTWGWQSAWAPRAVSDARAGVFCRVACAQSVCAGKNGIAAREAKTATAGAMRERLKRVRTDFSLMPRKLPLTRFTVKIRTPSLLSELRPPQLSWGKYDYMGVVPLDASRLHAENRPAPKVRAGNRLFRGIKHFKMSVSLSSPSLPRARASPPGTHG